MPKNTGLGIAISGVALILGFAVIWHMWWLALLSLLGIIACIMIRANQEETEYIIPAAEVARIENRGREGVI